MRGWWGVTRQKGLPGRAGPPVEERRDMRPSQVVTTTLLCMVSSGRPSDGQPIVRGELVSYR